MVPRPSWRGVLVALVGLLALALAPLALPPHPVAAATLAFRVTSTADAPDANPGDGVCADTAGQCTLRAATQEADAQPSGSAITVPAGTYGLTHGPLALSATSIAILGASRQPTVVSANYLSQVLSVAAGATALLAHMTLTAGVPQPPASFGGGIYNAGQLTLDGSTVSDNHGNGIYNDAGATVALIGSTIEGNAVRGTRGGDGGGLFNDGTATLTDSSVLSNTATYGGGLATYQGTITLTDSTVAGNAATERGGGLMSQSGTAVLTGSTVADNTAREGGGLYTALSGTATVTESTIAANTASQSSGAIYLDGGPVTLSYVTVAGNSSGLGSVLKSAVAEFTLTGTIVADSTTGPDCYGPVSEGQGYNLDSDDSCSLSQTSDLTATDPLLGPLANNGGPTETMALLPGSPAIDHGGTHATGCPVTDQRGLPRPDEPSDNGACDIGAYESQGVG